jgi:hypothetical protein
MVTASFRKGGESVCSNGDQGNAISWVSLAEFRFSPGGEARILSEFELIGEDMNPANGGPKRGFLLRFLYRVYTNYLGVTPPKPAQERTAAAVLIGGVILGLVGIVVLVLFLWETMARLGGAR